jgi:hypothetical protein
MLCVDDRDKLDGLGRRDAAVGGGGGDLPEGLDDRVDDVPRADRGQVDLDGPGPRNWRHDAIENQPGARDVAGLGLPAGRAFLKIYSNNIQPKRVRPRASRSIRKGAQLPTFGKRKDTWSFVPHYRIAHHFPALCSMALTATLPKPIIADRNRTRANGPRAAAGGAPRPGRTRRLALWETCARAFLD